PNISEDTSMSDNVERIDSVPVKLMRKLGFDPDTWQIEVLEGGHKRLLLNCCRQAGKSTVVALLILIEGLLWRNGLVVLLSGSPLICLSTPYGKRGFFHKEWSQGGADWARIEVAADKIPRIKPEFLQEERRAMGLSYYRQEYCCSFESVEGLIYPDFGRCVV